MTTYEMWHVGFFHVLDLILGKLDGQGSNSVIQVMRFSGADDRGGDQGITPIFWSWQSGSISRSSSR
jgi:hypothetical protein